ncbi:hypothetical protein A3B57_01190 [Microgenomates group bacterium RIFCSPLOWO2_01_FULL_47_10]|nr:MAG: hypothetical protein A3B57_01190 [Microgenomates group bacterium RIFCSPLOWO2_01_FULL_47_10]
MKTILVVEDDKLLGRTLCSFLEKAGFGVFWAESAKAAFEALSVQVIDLVFMDIMMPEMDGFTALKEIRLSKKYGNVPVVMLTNLSESCEMEKSKNLGATDFIVKANMDMSELVDRIHRQYLPE